MKKCLHVQCTPTEALLQGFRVVDFKSSVQLTRMLAASESFGPIGHAICHRCATVAGCVATAAVIVTSVSLSSVCGTLFRRTISI